MSIALRTFIRLPRISRIAAVRVFAAASLMAQNAAGPIPPAQLAAPAASAPASQASAHQPGQAHCAPNADIGIPVNATVQAKVTGPMNSGHLKVGKEFWVTVQQDIDYPGCKLSTGSAIYGHVMSAVSQGDASPAELSLAFDHADCEDHGKKPMPMWLIGLIGPSEVYARMHDDVAMGAISKKRSADTASKALSFNDAKLNPGGAPNTVHPGIVLGMPKLKLDVQGGPGCSSARISSTDRTADLELGSQLILVPQSAR